MPANWVDYETGEFCHTIIIIHNDEIKQENGQRKYTNPQFPGKPEKGTEIFIGKLPRDLFEDELYPVLAEYGP